MDRGAWWAAIHGVAKSQTQLHFHFSLSCIGEGNGNPLQCSCLENPRDGGAWWAAVYGVAQSWTGLKQLSSSSGYISNWRLARGVLFLSPSDAYVRSFVCLLYSLIKLLHKSSEWSNLVSGPRLNSSPPEAKNPGIFSLFSNSLSLWLFCSSLKTFCSCLTGLSWWSLQRN